MSTNKLIIAAAGSGKTTCLVDEALQQKDGRVLITTYTEANEAEIRKKIINIVGYIPENVVVQTWFSFLLQHGVRPYQGCLYRDEITGMVLVNQRSAPYASEANTKAFYFNNERKIYSDKISKFVVNCNKNSAGAVIDRLSRIFSSIFIDEVQDLASYDLDFLRLLFISTISTFLVGDPRQVLYLTHNAARYNQYSDGKIVDFLSNECRDIEIEIDDTTLMYSHRNNASICSLASKIYPNLPQIKPCECLNCRIPSQHDGIFLVREADLPAYLRTYNPVQLRLNRNTRGISEKYSAVNFGLSKGQSYDRVIIFPTDDMRRWLVDNNHDLAPKTRSQLYVGVTRAKHSVGIVYNFNEKTNINGTQKFIPE